MLWFNEQFPVEQALIMHIIYNSMSDVMEPTDKISFSLLNRHLE